MGPALLQPIHQAFQALAWQIGQASEQASLISGLLGAPKANHLPKKEQYFSVACSGGYSFFLLSFFKLCSAFSSSSPLSQKSVVDWNLNQNLQTQYSGTRSSFWKFRKKGSRSCFLVNQKTASRSCFLLLEAVFYCASRSCFLNLEAASWPRSCFLEAKKTAGSWKKQLAPKKEASRKQLLASRSCFLEQKLEKTASMKNRERCKNLKKCFFTL